MTSQLKPQESNQAEFVKPVSSVEIVATGMITSVGGDVDQTLAAVNAGISASKESDYYNKQFNPIIMSLVPDDALPPLDEALLESDKKLTLRQQRLLRIITPAIQQATEKLQNKPVALMLGGPEKLPGRRSIISDNFLKQIAEQTKVTIDFENSYVFPYGRASGLYALEAAMIHLEQGKSEYVLVGAADTHLDQYLLETLDLKDRLLSEGIMDAFIPGEAATFLLLKSSSSGSAVKIFPPGIAVEPGHLYSDQPYKGDGLADSIREAISNASANDIRTIFASFNGESFHSKEWGVSAIRNQKSFNENSQLMHPADCFGDIGAATGMTNVGLASMGILAGVYRKPALVWASSEMEQRAAICML